MSHADEFKGRGIDLEIWEPGDPGEIGVIAPYRVKINGVEVLAPEPNDELRSIVTFSDISRSKCLTATITMFVNSVTIHGGEDATR